MKKSSLILGSFLGLGIMVSGVVAATMNFSDVPADHWGKPAVDNLSAAGVIKGYPDGKFWGDKNITRYETAVVVDNNNKTMQAKMDAMNGQINKMQIKLIEMREGSIAQALESGEIIKEISNPKLMLPTDIHEGQIKKYFQIGNLYLAPILRGSSNIYLDLPNNFVRSFSGILIADKNDEVWSKLLEIKDDEVEESTGNDPYYLWADAKKMMVSIIDQNGGGSGEGVEKVYSTLNGWKWNLEGCYYYGADGTNPNWWINGDASGDWLAYSKNLSEQGTLSAEENTACKDDVILTSY